MSILVGKKTNLLIQGITGRIGQIHAGYTLEYGVHLLAGVTPGKGGQNVKGVPVYNQVKDAMKDHPEINATMILVPPQMVQEAALEAMEAGIALVVIITEFVPIRDMITVFDVSEKSRTTLIGPNTIGIISPGESKAGIMPGYIYQKGRIGIISRSGTLTHEVASNLSFAGYGQSTCLCIGGDPVTGLDHTRVLEFFRDDPETLAVILIGEIGGTSEENAARYIRETQYHKPVFAYITGTQAPGEKKMGHAGAIISGSTGTANSKIVSLREAGVRIAPTTGKLVSLIAEMDKEMTGNLMTVTPIGESLL
jgi:succinyl-CoA synthetase alpha subunit